MRQFDFIDIQDAGLIVAFVLRQKDTMGAMKLINALINSRVAAKGYTHIGTEERHDDTCAAISKEKHESDDLQAWVFTAPVDDDGELVK